MTTPVVESAITKEFATPATAHSVDYPATVNAGDLLIIIFACDANIAITAPAGYTTLDDEALAGAGHIGIYAKVAAGTEGGGTENLQTAASEEGCSQIFRISGWGGTIATDIDIAAPVAESTTTPDPPSVTAGWGADTNLFIAIVGAANDDAIATGGPSSWTNLLTVRANSGINDSPSIHTARLASSNAAENPGTFTLDESETCESFTLVIKPSAAAAGNIGIHLKQRLYI